MTVFWCEEMSDVVPGTLLAADPAEIEAALAGLTLPAGVGRPGRAGAAGRDAPDRVHRPGVPGRPGPRGVREVGHRARHAHAGRPPAGRPPGRAHLHAVDQGRRRARRQHRLRRRRSTWSAPRRRQRPGTSASSSTPGPRRGRPTSGSSWPTPSSSSATSTACSACATRCAPRTPRACGRPTRWSPGTTPPAFDKQPLRDWLAAQPWDRTPPPPALPASVTDALSARYVAAYERVTGLSLDDWYGATA